jgi:putative addiction module component (TIGR02574 family)
MSTANELLSQALSLPEAERAALARQLLLSLEAETAADADDAWALEIEARLAAIAEGRFQAKDWREALAEIRQKLSAGSSR